MGGKEERLHLDILLFLIFFLFHVETSCFIFSFHGLIKLFILV